MPYTPAKMLRNLFAVDEQARAPLLTSLNISVDQLSAGQNRAKGTILLLVQASNLSSLRIDGSPAQLSALRLPTQLPRIQSLKLGPEAHDVKSFLLLCLNITLLELCLSSTYLGQEGGPRWPEDWTSPFAHLPHLHTLEFRRHFNGSNMT